jgi:hypothetical protein
VDCALSSVKKISLKWVLNYIRYDINLISNERSATQNVWSCST